MIWLTWRQARTQILVIFGMVCALCIALALTGPHVADLADTDPTQFLSRLNTGSIERQIYLLGQLLFVVPPLIGVFWGAPLIAREIETGTHRLVWGQSITRRRWLSVKLAILALAAIAASGLLSLAMTWWAAPIDTSVAQGHGTGVFNTVRLNSVVFGARGVVPIAYTLFGLTLGIVVGLLIRRSVPAMAVTLAGIVLVQIMMPTTVRQHLVKPEVVTVAITDANLRELSIRGTPENVEGVERVTVEATKPGDWVLSNYTITSTGAVATTMPVWMVDCGGPPTKTAAAIAARKACFDRLAKEGYQQKVTYHPASAFWPMQWRESGLLVTAALLLSGFAFWRIRRDL